MLHRTGRPRRAGTPGMAGPVTTLVGAGENGGWTRTSVDLPAGRADAASGGASAGAEPPAEHAQAGWAAGCGALVVRLASRPARSMTNTPIPAPHNVQSTR